MSSQRSELPAAPEGRCLIGGQWRESATGEKIAAHCPSDGSVFAQLAAGSAPDINSAVKVARQAFDGGEWSRLTATDRGRLLSRLTVAIDSNAETLTQLEARDTGKPLKQARADIAAAVRYFEYYGGAADKVHGETIPFNAGFQAQSLREPRGVTAHIIPWSYPAQMLARPLAPALAMGTQWC